MSTITPTTLLDGAVVSTDAVNGNFDLLHEVNGKLDGVNLDMERTITYEQIQHRALSGGRTVAGTANLDYFNGVRYGISGIGTEPQERKMNKSLSNYLFLVTDTAGLKGKGLVTKGFAEKIDEADTPSKIDYTFQNVDATEAIPLAVPGASISFFVPYAARVLVTWQVTWTSDAARHGEGPKFPATGTSVTDEQAKNFPQPNTAVRLYVNGSEHNKASLTRESREAMFTQPSWKEGSPVDVVHALRDRYKSRYWSGHAFLGPLRKGFHTASLRVASGRNVRQMRVRARSMKIMYFKA